VAHYPDGILKTVVRGPEEMYMLSNIATGLINTWYPELLGAVVLPLSVPFRWIIPNGSVESPPPLHVQKMHSKNVAKALTRWYLRTKLSLCVSIISAFSLRTVKGQE